MPTARADRVQRRAYRSPSEAPPGDRVEPAAAARHSTFSPAVPSTHVALWQSVIMPSIDCVWNTATMPKVTATCTATTLRTNP